MYLCCGCFFRGFMLNEHQQQLVFLKKCVFLVRHKCHHGNNIGKPQQHLSGLTFTKLGCRKELSSEKVEVTFASDISWFSVQICTLYFKLVGAQISNVEKMAVFCEKMAVFCGPLKIFHLWDDRYRKSLWALCDGCFTPQDISLFHT